jgi:hypothetical protein
MDTEQPEAGWSDHDLCRLNPRVVETYPPVERCSPAHNATVVPTCETMLSLLSKHTVIGFLKSAFDH